MPGLIAVVPLDGTKLAESAFDLLPFVKTLGVETVRLVSVWESAWEEGEALPGRKAGEAQEVAEKGRTYLSAYLEQQAERVKAAGLTVETVVRVGRAADETLLVAQDADLLLLATHGRAGIDRWRLGSVADKVIREAACPTLVIGPNVSYDLTDYNAHRILVPLNGAGLSELALPVASWIAGLTGAELDLVRVVSMTPMAADPMMDVYPLDLYSAMEDAGRSYLARIAESLGPKRKVHTQLYLGAAGEMLLEHLKEHPAGLVVLASHGRAGVARAALGSVADRLLHGPSPVLVFRPEEEATSRLLLEARKNASA